MHTARRTRLGAIMAVAVACTLLLPPVPAPAAPPVQTPPPAETTDDLQPSVPAADRDQVLPRGWRSSDDRMMITSGDAAGLHVLVADQSAGYTWRTVATLAEPGFDADQWIGNACVTGSGRRAVVAYAPRTFANDAGLFDRGAFTAVVDLQTGAVAKLPSLSTLAYFSPGCGAGETAVLTRFRDDEIKGGAQTRLSVVDAGAHGVVREVTLNGTVTSAVPVEAGLVAADGARLVRIPDKGDPVGLVRTTNVPFDLRADGSGAVVYVERSGDRVRINRTSTRPGATASLLATGAVGTVGPLSPVGGRVFLAGTTDTVGKLPASVVRTTAGRSAQLSSRGHLAVTKLEQQRPGSAGADPTGPRSLRIDADVLATGKRVRFAVAPAPAAGRSAEHPSLAGRSAQGLTAGSPTDPVDTDRTCSVPRNDPRTQVYQPTPRQVEWAADQAVTGHLTMTRPANWRQSGLPAWSPQGMFPRPALAGGGRVPVQVLLGILTQESNLWQASSVALPGDTANPLIGNFYGRQLYNQNTGDDWIIDWSSADCGYGVAQVTDGMRLGDPARTANQQRAIALDYATNIAAGLQILVAKWNETRAAGLIVNDGDPANIENWFFAVWAYNSGFHPQAGAGQPWGVGWANNPANPRYPADRLPFLEDTYADAAHPQYWPYEEKVLGWAGHPIDSVVAPDTMIAGYRAAWWTTEQNRETVKPPVDQFCDTSNDCHPGMVFVPNDPSVTGEPAGPCGHRNASGKYDLQCWYHQATTWKDCNADCGYELLRFDETYPEQPDGISYPPNCSLSGLPTGALIIDDVADSVPSVRTSCGHPWTNQGTFGLTFAADGTGTYPSKVDFHQIGGGFGGHFWFARTRQSGEAQMKVTGTWTLNRSLSSWARVMVHMPDHGAHTQQASYEVDLGNGTKTRVVLQRTLQNRWVSLGAFPFTGVPRVRLSSQTLDGTGNDDIAFDAVAFQPLPGKPHDQVVALGDSYSSGEGASVTGGGDYYRETDNNGNDEATRNACHRSRNAWSRKAVLPSSPQPIGVRADAWDASMDYHLLACSGAWTNSVMPLLPYRPGPDEVHVEQYGELNQLDRGFADENTTLVTISIGGNDALFGDIIKKCVADFLHDCQDETLDGETQPLSVTEPQRLNIVESKVTGLLRQIRIKAPNAKVLLMGYPRLIEGDGACLAGVAGSGISPAESQWLAQTGQLLDQHLAAAVTAANGQGTRWAWYSDPNDEFAGKGVCGSPESIHGIVADKTPGDSPGIGASQQSFHPKNEGTTLYAQAMNQTVPALGL
ncbi:hypothetical protein GCM10017581_068400 [Dactylosporangium matsuzakiense]|uniref:Golvesin/Xly CBD-like domain-containing protein n=2 Tax=Dactylosporangium matsuzakiense TaxID=53360 RepID=A0A9W6KPB5_9ACTN|nr:hypothetical protein GCM10017581_068400 [Dactylosporangium matsuzakiense]